MLVSSTPLLLLVFAFAAQEGKLLFLFGGFEVCVKNDRSVGSLGVFLGDDPFDFVLPMTLFQIIIVGLISRGLEFFLRPIETPKFTGVLLGPSVFGRNEVILGTLFPLKQSIILLTLSKISLSYCVFLITLKMDVMTTLKGSKRCWRFGVFPFLASFFITIILLALYTPPDVKQKSGNDLPNVFTLGSFAVVSEALSDLNLIATELGQIALSSALISEILQWIAMSFQFNSGADLDFTLVLLAGSCGFAIICLFIVRPLVKIIIKTTPPGKPMKEIYVVLILLGVLIMAAISDTLGIYFVIGPALYGLVMPNGPPLATAMMERTEAIMTNFLMPFFYIYIGLETNLTGIHLHWKVFLVFQAILFVGFIVKVLTCVLISPTYNIKPKHGLVLGLILSVKGIVELIFLNRMHKLKVIDGEIFGQMVISVVLITTICIPLIKSLYKHCPRVLKTTSIHEGRVRTIQNICESSEFSIISCVHKDENVHSMIALLEACNPTIESPICVYAIHLIELLGKSTPILLPMNKLNKKSLSSSYPNTNHILRAFENYSDNSSGPVTVLSYVSVAPYSSMHEPICNLAEDKSVHLLIIPFHQNGHTPVSSHCSIPLRDLNDNFLATAKCTVGILMDRYSSLSRRSSKVYFHVGIFFIGGVDDREALALGIRILERPNTRVTLFRFVLPNCNSESIADKFMDNEEEMLELTLDESLIDEFKGKNIINGDCVTWHEVVVEDCIQVLEAIKGFENDYDLVMVGKRHNIGEFTDEEMSNFMDNADQLGIFGDLLASNEFCDGKVPVLILQCGQKRVKQSEKPRPPHIV
ncbi:hypothetical protein VNO77_43839 [Canavalia gladiata]|uniref:Cation/H+ exchanger domain-containing protein n=1 Tax=Canavalia gladiata TaxID=3824 RepID=A0AAN9JXH3_CANGL